MFGIMYEERSIDFHIVLPYLLFDVQNQIETVTNEAQKGQATYFSLYRPKEKEKYIYAWPIHNVRFCGQNTAKYRFFLIIT
jgi:hypothetical protein